MLTKQRVAALVGRAPGLWRAAQMVYRLTQPRLTVGVVGALFDEGGRLLLVEHVLHPRFPWGLPGGWMARGEEPAMTACREIYEETGLRVEPVKPLLIARTPYLPGHLDIAYLCRPVGALGAVRLSAELLSYRWLTADELAAQPVTRFHGLAVRLALAERAAWFV